MPDDSLRSKIERGTDADAAGAPRDVSPEDRAAARARRRAIAEQSLLNEPEVRARPARDRERKERDRGNRPLELRKPDQDRSIVIDLPPLPQRVRQRSRGTFYSFLLCVALPVLLSATYFLFIASPQYAVEFRFAVRQSSSTPSSSMSGLTAMLGMGSVDATDNYIVADFITSNQAVEELQKTLDIRKMYGRSDIDWLARFNESRSIEAFIPYWQRMVTASYDQITGIAVAQVRAFSAEDAYKIASTLGLLSENLINDIMLRPLKDAIRFAEGDVTRAEDRLKKARAEMTEFRNTEQQIDPQAGAVASNVLLAQTIRGTIAQNETDLATLRNQKVAANAPMAEMLTQRIKAGKDQLALVEAQVKSAAGANSSLAAMVVQFEQLTLEVQFAQGILQTATTNLEAARSAGLQQHLYVETYVKPTLPQSAIYPKRLFSVFATLFVCLLFWTLMILIVRSVREHLT